MSLTPIENQLLTSGRAFPWHEIYAPSAEGSIKFYTEALGLGASSMEMGEMGTYHMLSFNGQPVAGVVSTQNPQFAGVTPHWAVYLAVDDVDERVAKVRELGGSVLVPAMDVPTVGRMALIQDPQGASLWLFKGSPM
jgi:predicted enzyme related to lactoylglutathione lyase